MTNNNQDIQTDSHLIYHDIQEIEDNLRKEVEFLDLFSLWNNEDLVSPEENIEETPKKLIQTWEQINKVSWKFLPKDQPEVTERIIASKKVPENKHSKILEARFNRKKRSLKLGVKFEPVRDLITIAGSETLVTLAYGAIKKNKGAPAKQPPARRMRQSMTSQLSA